MRKILDIKDFRIGDSVAVVDGHIKDLGIVTIITKSRISVNWGMTSGYNYLPNQLINLSYKEPKIKTRITTKLVF